MWGILQPAPAGGQAEVAVAVASVSAAEWGMVRAAAVDVASLAAFTGYASQRFGAFEVCAQRRALAAWPPGRAEVGVLLLHRHQVLGRWTAEVPAAGMEP